MKIHPTLYKIRCNPMHPLNDVLPGLYVPLWVTRGALVAHWYAYASPRCRTSLYHWTFVSLSVSLWNDLAHPVFDGVGLAGFKSGTGTESGVGLAGYWPKQLSPYYCLLLFFPFLFFLSKG